jgi:hypothetical protein
MQSHNIGAADNGRRHQTTEQGSICLCVYISRVVSALLFDWQFLPAAKNA